MRFKPRPSAQHLCSQPLYCSHKLYPGRNHFSPLNTETSLETRQPRFHPLAHNHIEVSPLSHTHLETGGSYPRVGCTINSVEQVVLTEAGHIKNHTRIFLVNLPLSSLGQGLLQNPDLTPLHCTIRQDYYFPWSSGIHSYNLREYSSVWYQVATW